MIQRRPRRKSVRRYPHPVSGPQAAQHRLIYTNLRFHAAEQHCVISSMGNDLSASRNDAFVKQSNSILSITRILSSSTVSCSSSAPIRAVYCVVAITGIPTKNPGGFYQQDRIMIQHLPTMNNRHQFLLNIDHYQTTTLSASNSLRSFSSPFTS